MDLKETRKKIDGIDREIVSLLRSRLELSLQTAKIKEKIEDARREEEVIAHVRKFSKSLLSPDFSEKLFRQIMAESKALQKHDMTLIGFQGEHGAFSEFALLEFDKKAIPIPCREFADVFSMVNAGLLDYGIIPVENSIEGSVTQVNDLLINSDLSVVGEITMPIHHCLLSLPDTEYRDIKVVYSHPQALGQCRGFLQRNKLEAIPYYDTAGSAMMLSKERTRATAVIANRVCADIYNLEIVKENIEDNDSNRTRFMVIARQRGEGKGDKCIISFTIPHKSGSLFSTLKIFSDAGINLTRIESRPARADLKAFSFLLDFQGADTDKGIATALAKVKDSTLNMKLIGCYREGAK